MHSIAASLTGAEAVAGTTSGAPAGRRCHIGAILDRLDNTDHDAVVEALASRAMSNERIAAALNLGGHPCHSTTVRRHRNGLCRCTPEGKETPA